MIAHNQPMAASLIRLQVSIAASLRPYRERRMPGTAERGIRLRGAAHAGRANRGRPGLVGGADAA
ncbi:hypothetical protein GCM10010216_07480 [Streptomyces flaveolus]|nr:hypothetical protein GCM10010216_07480 [Streptomyces flaveolus]